MTRAIDVETENQRKERGQIEGWFAERGVTLRYRKVGDPDIQEEWVAVWSPPNAEGLHEGGGGSTKLAAAENAKRNYAEKYGT